MQQVDLAIVGGGLIGMSMAAALGHAPLKVALLEQNQTATGLHVPTLDRRTTGLSISSVRFFQRVGLWPQLESFATPIYDLRISEQNNFGSARIECENKAHEAIGYMLPNYSLIEVLQNHLQQLPSVEVIGSFEMKALSVRNSSYHLRGVVQGKEIQTLEAKVIAGCDGANSRVREWLGIGNSKKSYQQSALIFNIQVAKPIANTAFERFTRHGPLAVLPIGEDRYAVIWTLAADSVDQYLTLDENEFIASLQTAFGYRLGSIIAVGQRVAYPLSLQLSNQLTAWNAVLLGNAAQSLHPVAAQGFNLGLRDIQAFEVLLQKNAYDLSHMQALLAQYRQAREEDRENTIRLTDGLTRIFSATDRVSRAVRGIGLTALGSSSALQNIFMRRNLGVRYLLME